MLLVFVAATGTAAQEGAPSFDIERHPVSAQCARGAGSRDRLPCGAAPSYGRATSRLMVRRLMRQPSGVRTNSSS